MMRASHSMRAAARGTAHVVAFAVAVILLLALVAPPAVSLIVRLAGITGVRDAGNEITATSISLRWIDVALILLAMFGAARGSLAAMGTYGLRWNGAVASALATGAATGIGGVALICAVLLLGAVMHVGVPLLALREALGSALAWVVAFLAVAAMEELLFRGYPLAVLSRAFGFWPASLVLSALFLAAHLRNAGETAAGLLTVFLFGVLFSVLVRRTGALWYGIGLHAGWDWAQSFLFGVPDSGTIARGRLVAAHFDGPPWLTGGTAGPEGSAITVGLLMLAIWFATSRGSGGQDTARPGPTEICGMKVAS